MSKYISVKSSLTFLKSKAEQSKGAEDVRLDHARMFRACEQSQSIAPARSPDCQTREMVRAEVPALGLGSLRTATRLTVWRIKNRMTNEYKNLFLSASQRGENAL
jgi:hypothetical protein